MPLAAGTRLGPYEIVAPLGAGGMGEVYRARDQKLGRDVAIKILPQAVAGDAERLRRFEREAKALAALNHPHIAHVYGFEESPPAQSGQAPLRALVMELVPGESLETRLRRGAVPGREALDLARQIVDGLVAAHEKGIIHRDLKPANLQVTPDGALKILDFGLAKALTPDGDPGTTEGPTVTGQTQHGVIVGTAAYMSPEQARGQAVDARTDVWAFGCVVYELLTGARAFSGPTVTDVLAAVLEREPEWTKLPAATPVPVVTLLRRCLKKDARQRLHHIADARFDLEEGSAAVSGASSAVAGQGAAARSVPPRASTGSRVVRFAALAVFLVAVAGAGWMLGRRTTTEEAADGVTRLTMPTEAALAVDTSQSPVLAVAPGGRRIAYVSRSSGVAQIYLRRLDDYVAEAIKGTESAQGPFFSPDGEWLGFESGGELKKVRLRDGVIVPICSGATKMHGASWHANGKIVFGASVENRSGLSLVSADGGAPESFLVPRGPDGASDEAYLAYPSWLPDGNAVIFTVLRYNHEALRLSVRSVDGRERRVLVESAGNGVALQSGHLVFARNNGLSAVAFDLSSRTVRGSPVPLLQDAFRDPAVEPALAHYSLSRDGALVYARGPASAAAPEPVWVDRAGRVDASLGSAVRRHPREIPVVMGPTLSPDGRRLLFWTQVLSLAGRPPTLSLWIQDLARDSLTKLPVRGNIGWSMWTPDGKRLLLEIADEDVLSASLFLARTDGLGEPERLTTAPTGRWQNPLAFTPDGSTLIYQESEKGADFDLWALPMTGRREPRALFNSRTEEELLAALSPNGRWLAYVSTATGKPQVYLTDFPGLSARQQVSSAGGSAPKWSADGRQLFFTDGESEFQLTLFAADTSKIDRGVIGAPAAVLSGPYRTRPYGPDYDIARDGSRFLFVRSPAAEAPSSLAVVLHWFDELRAAVPVPK
jgi:Tol biopolymer transport system component